MGLCASSASGGVPAGAEPAAPAVLETTQPAEPTAQPSSAPSELPPASAANASPPAQWDDSRPLVSELLEAHAGAIAELASILRETEPLFDPNLHDGLWLVRFLLSHKMSVNASAKAARQTLQWRAANKMDAIAHTVLSKPLTEWPGYGTVFPHLPIHYMAPMGIDGPLVMLVESNECSVSQLMKEKDIERAYIQFMLHSLEYTYQYTDRATRMSGRLTKLHRVLCLPTLSRRHISFSFFRIAGSREIKQAQNSYPQVLGIMFLLDLPPAMAWTWHHFIQPLLPTRTAEKTEMITLSKEKDRAKMDVVLPEKLMPRRLYGGGGDLLPHPSTLSLNDNGPKVERA